ncbi:hypothetical protein Gpo141_00010594 [Globisporangium polare]
MPLPTASFTNTEILLTLSQASVVRPTWLSAHSQALVALKEIDRVQVVVIATTPGHRDTYMVETYRSPASKHRIPTNQQQTEEITQRERPAVSIHRSYDDFVELRRKIYSPVHNAHVSQLCPFCDEVMSELIGCNATPNLVTKLLIGDARVAQRLTKFLNFILDLTKNYSASKGEHRCSGQVVVPLLLHDFIAGQELAATATALP